MIIYTDENIHIEVPPSATTPFILKMRLRSDEPDEFVTVDEAMYELANRGEALVAALAELIAYRQAVSYGVKDG